MVSSTNCFLRESAQFSGPERILFHFLEDKIGPDSSADGSARFPSNFRYSPDFLFLSQPDFKKRLGAYFRNGQNRMWEFVRRV